MKDLVATIGTSEDSVSVAVQEISPQDWMEKVCRPDIEKNMADLYKRPGYKPF